MIATTLIAPLAQAAPTASGSYIVQVAKGANAAVETRAKGLGGTIGFRYNVVINGFSVKLPNAAVDALSRTPGVDAIEAGREELIRALRRESLPVQKLAGSPVVEEVCRALGFGDLDALYAAIGEGHVSARAVAQRIHRGLNKGQAHILTHPEGRTAWRLKRWLPYGWYLATLRRRMAQLQLRMQRPARAA